MMNDLIQFAENEFGIATLEHEFDHMGYMLGREETLNTGKHNCYLGT